MRFGVTIPETEKTRSILLVWKPFPVCLEGLRQFQGGSDFGTFSKQFSIQSSNLNIRIHFSILRVPNPAKRGMGGASCAGSEVSDHLDQPQVGVVVFEASRYPRVDNLGVIYKI